MDEAVAEPTGAEAGSSEASRRREAADEVILEALAGGSSYSEAALTANVSARTVRRRMTDPAFAAELARRRALRVSDLTGRILSLGERAIAVLGEALDADSVTDRMRAANLILTSLRRYRADGDVDLRLTVLEASPASALGSQRQYWGET